MITVTKTFLPKKEKYLAYVDEIYKNNWITNNGPLVRLLEKKLADYLGVKNIVLVANGTVALEIAYRTLGLKGYVMTTPFSFVATTSSLVTNNLFPIFVDIESDTFLIDPAKIENLITPNTSAILPVHVFGNVCSVESIDSIAKQHNLKVIYDAAHAFGVKYKDKSVLNYGDISVLSFHATKLFHTIEGGALIINDDSLVEKARFLINFGINGPDSVMELGTNAKMNEFEAAMGLCILDDIDILLDKRKICYEIYYNLLKDYVQLQKIESDIAYNFSYFPIVLKNEMDVLKIQKSLNENNIFPRRYFHPSLDLLNYIEPKQFCPNSRDISNRILCLPMFYDLTLDEQINIADIIKKHLA
ncbi:MAG: DegT/DnrJ/EryC1/StrS family aminotransferase [Sulfurospirillum cavolei]|nr:DegT/DnrJ/EryC1/StrS family aminotransferase [Sulfurospirillum cavolei]